MELNLQGKSALVTGASSGIGRATAIALAREGAQVAIHGRRKENLDELAEEIATAHGQRPAVIICELLEDDAADRIVREAVDALGAVDILVNNAGGTRHMGADAPDEQWTEATTLNFIRPRQLGTRLLDGMRARRWGRIINVTGKSEPNGVNGAVSAKAAVHAWAKGLSREVGPAGITVNCVAPGKILSDQIMRVYTEEFRTRQAAEDIPVRRYGDPGDVANMIAYLASPIADYITGVVVPVDGGLRRYQF